MGTDRHTNVYTLQINIYTCITLVLNTNIHVHVHENKNPLEITGEIVKRK